MILRVTLFCLTLTACSQMPQVVWPSGDAGPAPALLPLDELGLGAASSIDSRGAALAAQAAALTARAATLGN